MKIKNYVNVDCPTPTEHQAKHIVILLPHRRYQTRMFISRLITAISSSKASVLQLSKMALRPMSSAATGTVKSAIHHEHYLMFF